MKLVREHLNEIRQNTERTGLGNIGVGKINVCPAYNELVKLYPGWINNFSTASIEDVNDILLQSFTKCAEYFKCPISSIKWANQSWISTECRNKLGELLSTATDIITEKLLNSNMQTSSELGLCILTYIGSERQIFILKSPTR